MHPFSLVTRALAGATGAAALLLSVAAAEAAGPALLGAKGAETARRAAAPAALVHKVGKRSRYRRSRAQVRGYRRRAGGYSYAPQDTVNTYGDSRTNFGGANSYRDPMLDRQTPSGPFDHGWFFDSPTGLGISNSPYPN